MASPVFSVSILQEQGLNGSRSLFVPTGFVWVLRDLDVYKNHLPLPLDQLFVIGDNGQTIIYNDWSSVDAGRVYAWRGRQVVATGIIVTTNCAMDVSISGYALSLP